MQSNIYFKYAYIYDTIPGHSFFKMVTFIFNKENICVFNKPPFFLACNLFEQG